VGRSVDFITARLAHAKKTCFVVILRQPQITSVLVGASRAMQVEELHAGLSYPQPTDSELEQIEECLK
jgi:predicted aldo/keto reductase-like oxidoreductase